MAEPATAEHDLVTVCSVDGNPLAGRQRYCSARCRQAAHRQRHAASPVDEGVTPEQRASARRRQKTLWNAQVSFMRWVERYRDQLSFEDMAAIPMAWVTEVTSDREQQRYADPKRARARERSRERRERMRSERPGNILG